MSQEQEITIGVLALQGAFAKHVEVLEKLNVQPIQIRYAEQLTRCDGLIIPGGESTAITHQIKEMNLLPSLKNFAEHSPVFGTCAGLILMAEDGILSLLDISVTRNAYGRQCDSFFLDLELNFSPLQTSHTFSAFFIRAPRISKIHSQQVRILAEYSKEPVLVQQGIHLAATFHPELTNDTYIHKYFIELCKIKQSLPLLSKTIHTKFSQTT